MRMQISYDQTWILHKSYYFSIVNFSFKMGKIEFREGDENYRNVTKATGNRLRLID